MTLREGERRRQQSKQDRAANRAAPEKSWKGKKKVADRYDCSKKTIERWVKLGRFPKGIRFPNGHDYWTDEMLDAHAPRHPRHRRRHQNKLFGEIIEIADDASGDYVTTSDGKRIVDHENIQRSRLRVDARKWAAARLAPRKYGDRVEHDVKGVSFQPSVLVQVGVGTRPTELKTISQTGEVIEAE
jgi:hypothetical protein